MTPNADLASDDHARPVAEAFGATYVSQERDEGPQAARSVGAELADCEYVQFLDDDDRLAPSKVRKQVSRLGPEVGVVYCGIDDEARDGILPNPVVRGGLTRWRPNDGLRR
ncbi:glycosyltransferase family A protein [Halorussus pelagicus]|uniref:glycosyltransferase family A protein n=1 Tax=Halorussus pelagicus TaxID=2505977 RepID=UPI000FFBF789|nr:glycosyltransferase family A protein [Halorussus pelagicus]